MAKEIPISSIDGLQEALDASVQHRYADVATMLASQSEQAVGNLIRVADATADPNVSTGSAYYDYTGAATADLGDYFLVTAPESASLSDGLGTTANGNAVDLGGGSILTGQRVIEIAAGAGPANQLRINAQTGQTTRKTLQLQQNIASWYGWTDDVSFAGVGVEDDGAGNLNGSGSSGQIAGLYAKQIGAAGTTFGAGIYALATGELIVFPGALRSNMLAFKYLADYAGIDWATDLAGDGLYIPHQKRVQAMIDASGGGGAALETRQSLTVTDANYTAALALNANANVIAITLDAALTNDWQPSGITGWVVGRRYLFEIIKASNNGIDLTTARAVPNVGYDNDVNPFIALDTDIDTTQKRAVIEAVGFKSTFGQFGRLIITDTGYVE